jgi:phage gpG-like protein
VLALPLLLAAIAPMRVDRPPRVDGRLDDAAWAAAPASDAFTQKFPRDGERPSQPTRVQVVYDDDSVYVAIECVQAGPASARLTRRDREVGDDRVSVDLDTTHDRRGAFHFQISAAGVHVDGLRYDDTELASDWDEIWEGEVARTVTGWTAELRIPFRILRLRRGGATWGFQVRRWIGATGELDEWAYASRDTGGEVSRYGDLGPFAGLAPRGSIALVPFALSRVVHTDAEVPSPYGDGLSAAAGLDLTWRPSPGVAVAGAVLPDFAQVEADQVVLNLTTTETEYPEKRPFFLQGLDLFRTPIQLLYTRRIGEPADPPALPDGVTQTRPPGAAPILGAAKLVGSAAGLELGALSAVTGGVDAVTDAGAVAAAPLAAHHVARVRLTRDRLAVGALATARTAYEDPGRYPGVMDGDGVLCPGGAVVAIGARCTHDAFTGGLDGAWRSEAGAWTAGGQLAATRLEGGPPLQRPDGTIVRSGDGGFGGIARLAKEGGGLRFEALYERYGRRFDIDDLGYQPRANLEHGSLDLEAYSARPFGPFVESRSRIELFFRRTLDGLRGSSGYQWNVSGTTQDLWHGFLELHWRPDTFDDRELGDGRALQHSGKLGLEAELRSDTRRAVVGGLALYAASLHEGGLVSASAELDARPRDDLEIGVAPELYVTRGEPRYVDEDALGPRFARQDATSFGVTARTTWTLQRDLTVQAFVQALLATIRYRDAFVGDAGDRVIAIAELRPASFDPSMYDGRTGVLDATIVGRWEYRPGSTAFLVYSHAQSPVTEGATYDPAALARGPASDVVLLKLSWAWLR